MPTARCACSRACRRRGNRYCDHGLGIFREQHHICQRLQLVPHVRRGTCPVPRSTAAKEIVSDDAALLRYGSGGWLLIRYVYHAAPLSVGVQTPNRYSPEMNRHWRTVWSGRGQFVLAAHVGQLAVR